MIENDFAKFDGARGINLDEVIQDAANMASEEAANGVNLWDELEKMIQDFQNAGVPTELDGYWPYKFYVGNSTYYPRKDTVKRLPTGWVLFVDDLNSDDEELVWVTVQHSEIKGITWLPGLDVVEAKAAKAA